MTTRSEMLPGEERLREAVPDELRQELGEKVEENPYLVTATAFALGFVLGGGLTPSLLMRGVGIGARAAAVAVARDVITSR